MIAKVTNIIKKTTGKGAKYLNVTYEVNGKKSSINSFESADNATFSQANGNGQFVDITVEKNDKGYDQIKNVKFVKDAIPPEQPALVDPLKTMRASAEGKIKPSSEDTTPLGRVLNTYNQNEERTRSITLSYAVTLVANGRIKPDDLYAKADEMARYVVNGKIEVES